MPPVSCKPPVKWPCFPLASSQCVPILLFIFLLLVQQPQKSVLANAQSPSSSSTNANNPPTGPTHGQLQQQQQQQQKPQSLADRQSQPTQPGADDEYLIGLGIADITGPSADINLVSVLSQLAEMAADLLVRPSSSSSSSFSPASSRSSSPQIASVLASAFSKHRRKLESEKPLIAANPIRPLKPHSKSACDIQGRRRRAIAACQWTAAASNGAEMGSGSSKKVKCKPQTSGICKQKANYLMRNGHFDNYAFRKHRDATLIEERQATISLDDRPLLNLAYPSWRDLQNFKLQMGYAKPNQDAGGIHLRQFSRALIVEDKLGARVLYVNLDNGMISQLLRTRVLRRLQEDFGAHTYNASNVMLTATHTHSCPGGFFQYMLYNIPSAGFISQTLEALVDGIARSVSRAQASLQPGRMYYTHGELLDASINRSPTSYANNPLEERAQYAHDTDKTMVLLRLVDSRGAPLGMLNWFAVHGTSMNNSNHLISSDNKGYAALLMEQEFEAMRQEQVAASEKNSGANPTTNAKFVAIFAQANEGDVSPNTRGPRCIDTGLPCQDASSTCGTPPRNEKCIASGPGRDMFESTKIIAYKQYFKARQLFLDEANQRQVRGPIRYVHEHIDMTRQQVPSYESMALLQKRAASLAQQQQQQQNMKQLLQPVNKLRRRQDKRQTQDVNSMPLNNTTTGSNFETCLPALGYSFAAGTTDGPGAFDFQQGDTVSTRYWNMVRDFLRRPSPAQMKCHHPKPILLATGEMDFPYMWHPKVVPTQILMLGQLAIVGLPGEFTTMAGRRVRAAVKQALETGASGQYSNYPPNLLVDLNDDDDAEDDLQDNLEEQQDDAREEKQLRNNTGSRHLDLLSDEARHQKRMRANMNRKQRSQTRTRRLERQQQRPEVEVVLSGLSNIYTSYITTIEEYEMQRYEGASTLYGPHTLQAYVNQFARLASLLASSKTSGNVPIDDSLQPPDLTKSLFTLKPGVVYDGAPHNKRFGDLLQDVDVKRVFKCGEQVSATFVAGNPRNDLKQEQSYLYVDKYDPDSRTWTTIASDASWDTKFIWERTNTLFGESKAIIEWDIPVAAATPNSCQSGIYRLRHYGAHKSLMQKVSQYAGKSAPFTVLNEHHATTTNQTISVQLNQLEQLRQMAEQMEALQASLDVTSEQQETVSSQPKSDVVANDGSEPNGTRHLSSLLMAPLRYLSNSLARWKW